MIQTSNAWKEYSKTNSVFHPSAVLKSADGQTLNLAESDFMMNGVKFTDSISGANEISLGGVITNSVNVTLNNTTGKFNDFNLNGAVLTLMYTADFEGSETIQRGVYRLEKPQTLGMTISLTGYDRMDKLNRYFTGVINQSTIITYPISAKTLVGGLCGYCGVPYLADFFDVPDFYVGKFEYDESTTCRQVISWVLQTAGAFARVSNLGNLEVRPFYVAGWEQLGSWDGGTFQPWNIGDVVNGGTMSPWATVVTVDGGRIAGDAYEVFKIKNSKIGVDELHVTGVRAYAYNTVDEFEFSTAGSDGYLLSVDGNPLVTNNTQTVANRIWSNINGLWFRPFEVNCFGDPAIEAGDAIIVQDYNGTLYASIITNMTYTVGNMRITCDCKSEEGNAIQTANPQTQMIQGATRAAYDYIVAKKLTAETINAGVLQSKEGTPPKFYLNLDTGVLRMDASALSIQGDDIADYVDGRAEDEANEVLDVFIDGQYADDLTALQDQIDGSISTWFYDYDPTLNNAPASEWQTVADKNEHLGDIFYNTSTGYSFRFSKNGDTYYWAEITDSAVAEALSLANQALDTADHKTTTYYGNRTDTFDPAPSTGDTLISQTEKTIYRWNGSAWVSSYEYATYVDGQISSLNTLLTGQIDQKIETWYQSADPSSGWSNAEKVKHEGDLWYYTGQTTSTLTADATYRYALVSGTYKWEEMNASELVFDKIDGKSTIFSGTVPFADADPKLNDMAIDTNTRKIYRYNGSTWVEVDNYYTAFTSLQGQLDAKIETYAQSTNPNTWSSADRTKHDGDLWYYTGISNLTIDGVTIQPTKTYQYNASTNRWALYEQLTRSLFDLADGKNSVWYGTPSDTFPNLQTRDYLVDKDNGTTYMWNGTTWEPVTFASINNLMPSSYYREVASGNVWTNNGITWTLNPNGSVTATGSATANSSYLFTATSLTGSPPPIYVDSESRYTLSGCPAMSGVQLRMRCTPHGQEPSSSDPVLVDAGTGTTTTASYDYFAVYARITSGTALPNGGVTFYPMLEIGDTVHNYVQSYFDTKSVANEVVSDYDTALNQQRVFNKLTNNGALQGIYMDNGQLYVNGTYIKAGTIEAARIGAGSFTMTGGSINVNTGSTDYSVMILRSDYGRTEVSPQRFAMSAIDSNNETFMVDYAPSLQTAKMSVRLYEDGYLGIGADSNGNLTVYGDAEFHGGVEIGGYPVADHVRKQGTEGGFRYRLWASGFKEYWVENYSLGTVNFATQYGALYYYTSRSYSWLDILPSFQNSPSVYISANAPLGLIFASVKEITNSSYSFYLANDHQGSFSVSINVYICGK